MKTCRYCGYEGPIVCEGLGPRMGCDMPGQRPGVNDREPVTARNYCEAAYLAANDDVRGAVERGDFPSGRAHFERYGAKESRYQLISVAHDAAAARKERIRATLADMPYVETGRVFDFLTPDLRAQFNIIDTENVSSNMYDGDVLALIEKHRDGLILDCGAGSRPVYYENVVNFEIAAYPSTDVRGVGEVLPFKDNSFDAVVSVAVLEHVKDPFQCAREIVRVLKPGGDLLCCVPFLQPMHGYPHHYYNMTRSGIRNLFEPHIEIHRHETPDSVLPIWSLTWMLKSWAAGLTGEALAQFRSMTVADLMWNPVDYLEMPFVRGLPTEVNFELASATVIHGTKTR